MTYASMSFKNKLLFLIIVLIGFQQFPVIRVGGSFKIYELLAIIVMFINLIQIKDVKFVKIVSIFAFLFFVVSPIFSYLYLNFFIGYPSAYYTRFPHAAESFKHNFYVFPLLQMIYMFFNFAVFNSLLSATELYRNFEQFV